MIDFINKWQTLIGSALGPFLAVILSAVGYLIKIHLEKRAEIKESMRRIEVSVTTTLNDIYFVREQLKHFAKEVKKLAREARAENNPKAFFMHRINCPAFLEVYRDPYVHDLKIKSYYIHNQTLFSDSRVKEMNKILAQLKNDFEDVIRQNETLVALMQENPNPPAQRLIYAENLEAFATGIENYASESLKKPIKALTQIKVYNDLLRRPRGRGYWTWRKMENPIFKFRLSKAERIKFSKNLDSLDRINAIIEQDVEKFLKETETRMSSSYPSLDV